jgi:hypothetical protein
MAFFWSKSEAMKKDNKFVYIRNFTSIEVIMHAVHACLDTDT